MIYNSKDIVSDSSHVLDRSPRNLLSTNIISLQHAVNAVRPRPRCGPTVTVSRPDLASACLALSAEFGKRQLDVITAAPDGADAASAV